MKNSKTLASSSILASLLCASCTPFSIASGAFSAYGYWKVDKLEDRIENIEAQLVEIKSPNKANSIHYVSLCTLCGYWQSKEEERLKNGFKYAEGTNNAR